MNSDIQQCLQIYQQQLNDGYIQKAYITLTKYMAEIKRHFIDGYSTSNIGPGYLDYTYLYFVNDYLNEHNLKFVLAINHKELRFELWLSARVAREQKRYWNLLKDSKWNKGKTVMPKYSMIEIPLQTKIDFTNKEMMTYSLLKEVESNALEIEAYLRKLSL